MRKAVVFIKFPKSYVGKNNMQRNHNNILHEIVFVLTYYRIHMYLLPNYIIHNIGTS